MTASSANNVILTKDSYQVTIATSGDEENFTKNLILITPPTVTKDQSPEEGAKDTMIVDLLLKAERRVTVDGHLATGLGSGDTSWDSEGKKSNLRTMFFAGGTMTMTYEGSDITIGIDKMSIKRIPTEGLMARDGESGFSVKFTAVEGVNFG